jgi:SAM-dependent methyltransferase
MDYQSSFKRRASSFLNAVNNFDCYNNELKVAVEYLSPQEGESIVNLGGGGININKFLPTTVEYIPLEFSKEFSELTGIPLVKHSELPFESRSIDKFLILALLHHFSHAEREELYTEIYRSLKSGGKMVIADVIKDSKQDFWLNKFVDRFNPFGHNGVFFTKNDSKLMEKVGFDVDIRKIKYNWEFSDLNEMCFFVKSLFYLDISDEYLQNSLENIFIIIVSLVKKLIILF